MPTTQPKPHPHVTVTGARVEVIPALRKILIFVDGEELCACPLMGSTVEKIVKREAKLDAGKVKSA